MLHGNRRAVKLLENYVKKGGSQNLLLKGPKGVGKYTAARMIACKLLKCEDNKLDCNPDAMIISKEDAIKVEDIKAIIEFCSIKALYASRKIIIIDNCETMNELAQNKLLKTLEESGNNIFILISSAPLLETITSRTIDVPFTRISDCEMEEYFQERNETPEIPFELLDGSIGMYEFLKSDKEFFEDIKELVHVITNMKEKKEFLSAFHVLKEKDEKEFFSKHKSKIPAVISFLQKIYLQAFLVKKGLLYQYRYNLVNLYDQEEILSICAMLGEHLAKCVKPSYSKIDFAQLVYSLN